MRRAANLKILSVFPARVYSMNLHNSRDFPTNENYRQKSRADSLHPEE